MLLLLLLLFCHEDSGRQEHINKIGFSLESSASEVLAGLGVMCSDFLAENTSRAAVLNTDCIADVAVFHVIQLYSVCTSMGMYKYTTVTIGHPPLSVDQ